MVALANQAAGAVCVGSAYPGFAATCETQPSRLALCVAGAGRAGVGFANLSRRTVGFTATVGFLADTSEAELAGLAFFVCDAALTALQSTHFAL